MTNATVLLCACLLDALLGDPYQMPHIIRGIGWLIAACERLLRTVTPATPEGERRAGVVLVIAVLGFSCGCATLVLRLAQSCSPVMGFVVSTVVCYQMIAARQLAKEARKVYQALTAEGLQAGRRAVSMIVGRDTEALDEQGVIRAAIETVAENASDGVVAPLLFMAIGGPVAGVFYKAVNTMDSMVGYKNERYRYLGSAAARLDDVCNWIPARITAMLMCLVAPLVGLDARGAWRIWRRDHAKHASPNSAHPEAACAGALGVQLAGPASYFGTVVDKPYIGDATRPVETRDILAANRLLYATSVGALVLAWGLSCGVASLLGR